MNNKEPEITVLMSVYNHEPFLDEAIGSILNQTYENFEFLIFEDCSNDSSAKILEKYESQDKRIKLIKNTINHGLGHNLAKGIEMAKGKYIARMDSDDISMPNRLETQYKHFANNDNYDIIGSTAIEIDKNGNETGIRPVPLQHNKISQYICLCPFIHPSVMYKKDSILGVGNYKNLRRKQDYDLWFRCFDNNLQFKNIEEPLLKYRYCGSFFERYTFKSTLLSVKIGLKWCFKRKTNPKNFYRVIHKLIGTIGPVSFRQKYSEFFKKFDKSYF